MHHENTHELGADLVFSALRRRFALILACALIGVAAGWYYGASQPPSYTSAASVLINPVDGSPYAPTGRSDDLTSLETEAQIVRSDAVLQMVADSTDDGLSPAVLEEHVRIIVPVNTQILQISYDATDATVARKTAQAFAAAYLDHRGERAQEVVAAQLTGVETQIEKVIGDLRTATAASQKGTAAARAFQAELARALNSELINLRAQHLALETTSPQPGRIISPASLPLGGSGLMRLAFPVAGGMAGLFFGFMLGLVLERKRGLVWSIHDVQVAGVPVLAQFSRSRRWRPSRSRRVAEFDESIRRVRAAVLSADGQGSTVAVACCWQQGIEPGIADALAASLAKGGSEVILVDADQHPDNQPPAPGPGLTDLLSGQQSDAQSMLVTTGNRRIRVLPPGEQAPGHSDHFVQDRLEASLAPLVQDCDFLILKAPTLQSTQGEAMARAAHLTVVVVRSGRARKSEVTSVALRADDSQTTLLGAILMPRRASLPHEKPSATRTRKRRFGIAHVRRSRRNRASVASAGETTSRSANRSDLRTGAEPASADQEPSPFVAS